MSRYLGFQSPLQPRHLQWYRAAITNTTGAERIAVATGKRMHLCFLSVGNTGDDDHVQAIYWGSGNQSSSTKALNFTVPALGGMVAVNLMQCEFVGPLSTGLWTMRLTSGTATIYMNFGYFIS